MPDLNLSRRWILGSALAEGGFGRVYEATDEEGTGAVAKLIPKAPGAQRELLFEELSGGVNIVPVIDSGETEEHYVLVMPRAERSLREHIAGAAVGLEEAIGILIDVAEALAGLDAHVVHRDLKPDNVLLLEGHWCLADFGIARYAEATTSEHTHKFAMTAPYAAPEQWRGERATSATDIYAFGVMAFELLQGSLPFGGPDFRRQHLEEVPPALTGCPDSIASLVSECLYKPNAARPTAANVLARLKTQAAPASEAFAKLESVNRQVVERQAEAEARASADRSRGETRTELLNAARGSLDRVLSALTERVLAAAPATEVSKNRDGGVALQLGDGRLGVEPVRAAEDAVLAAYDYAPPFDVIAYTAIAVRKPRDRYDYEGRAHSLWFGDAQEEGIYRWFELAFMVQPTIPERYTIDPFALPPTDQDAKECLTPVMTIRQVAWQPLAFDQGDESQFVERWVAWFAAAAAGTLSHPSTMPEQSGGSYRYPQHRPRDVFPF